MAYPTATSPPQTPTKTRFLLRADHGFLAATTERAAGPPIQLTPIPEAATTFVDPHTAHQRARMLTALGWSNLRVVELRLPLLCR